MEIEIKRISMETIKPSPPIPRPLQKHNFSSLDQGSPPYFIPVVYFYKSNPKYTNSEKSEQLKKSLSDVLSIFYPVAGRVVGNHYVDCSDGGAPFCEAEANCRLSQVLPNPDHKIMAKFLPNYKLDEPQDFCLAVQATYFRCGGFTLGILLLHKVADRRVICHDVRQCLGRRRQTRGLRWRASPEVGRRRLFPATAGHLRFRPCHDVDERRYRYQTHHIPGHKNRRTSRNVHRLRRRGAPESGGGGVSFYMEPVHIRHGSAIRPESKIYLVSHAVNFRSRVKPPLSEYHFGNLVELSIAMPAAGDGGVEVVQKIRAAVEAIDGPILASSPDIIKMALDEKVVHMSFSSPCGSGFSFYEADFGWGTPIWVGLGRFPYKNMVYFMDTKSGGGIEALIHLTKQDMLKFEAANLELQLQMLKKSNL